MNLYIIWIIVWTVSLWVTGTLCPLKKSLLQCDSAVRKTKLTWELVCLWHFSSNPFLRDQIECVQLISKSNDTICPSGERISRFKSFIQMPPASGHGLLCQLDVASGCLLNDNFFCTFLSLVPSSQRLQHSLRGSHSQLMDVYLNSV